MPFSMGRSRRSKLKLHRSRTWHVLVPSQQERVAGIPSGSRPVMLEVVPAWPHKASMPLA